jgi:hypothetical protein
VLSNDNAALAYLVGQGFGDGMLDSCFIQIREYSFG